MSTGKTNNFMAIQQSRRCGCLNCLRIYPAPEIAEWIETDNEKTALCPYCGTDYVLGDSAHDIDEIISKLKYDRKRHKR